MNRKQLIVYAAVIIVSVIVLLSLFIASFFPKNTPIEVTLSPSPSNTLRGIGGYPPLPLQASDSANRANHPNGTILQQTITPAAQKEIEKDQTIGTLIKKLPFRSATFALRYDIDTNSFIVSFIQDKLNQANQDFDQFLKTNGIENRNWLYNLSVKQLTY